MNCLEETLFDMQKDPGEMKNLAGLEGYGKVVEKMRMTLRAEAGRHNVEIELPAGDGEAGERRAVR